ncbi:hypothetical protein SUDANB19_04240 [Streptomyces sp. enrichment culture]
MTDSSDLRDAPLSAPPARPLPETATTTASAAGAATASAATATAALSATAKSASAVSAAGATSAAASATSATSAASAVSAVSAVSAAAAASATAAGAATARVVLLTGPSGSGKTRLAGRSGLPVLRLDDFYKEGDDPTLPRLGTAVDWDSPGSWDADAALRAISDLCHHGTATTPRYDIARSARTGHEHLDLAGSPLFIAEGIFAADIAARCAALGLLADAICLRERPTTTFRRRLLRDIRESRKPLPVLLRRGWRLLRAEPALVARHRALGAHPCTHEEAASRITRLRTTAAPAPREDA